MACQSMNRIESKPITITRWIHNPITIPTDITTLALGIYLTTS